MNSETIKLILDNNNSVIKDFVTTMYNSLKQEINDLRNENRDLKNSLEFSQKEIDELKDKCNRQELRAANFEDSFSNIPAMENKLRNLEDWNRRKNLRISGIPEANSEPTDSTRCLAQNIITEKLGLPEIEIKNAFRAKGASGSEAPRQIIVSLKTERDKISCLKSSSKLKNSNIYVNDDVSAATAAIRRSKLPELKEKRRQGLIAYFSGANIITRQRTMAGIRPNDSSSPNPHYNAVTQQTPTQNNSRAEIPQNKSGHRGAAAAGASIVGNRKYATRGNK